MSALARIPKPTGWLFRLIGLGLLVYLLSRLELAQTYAIMREAAPSLLAAALVLLLPLIGIKAMRWHRLLQAPPVWSAYLHLLRVYFAGLFLGFITPGRVGEFGRAYYVRDFAGGRTSRALVAVVVDRLYDLAALLGLGGAAALALPTLPAQAMGWIGMTGAVLLPAVLEAGALGWFDRGLKAAGIELPSRATTALTALGELPAGQIVPASLLTLLAYLLFFGQGYLLARALDLRLGYVEVAQTLAVGSLAALLPISISGLGTREWVFTFYLGAFGISAERAVAFSGLVFLVFNVGGGLLGAAAWLTTPDRSSLRGTEGVAGLRKSLVRKGENE